MAVNQEHLDSALAMGREKVLKWQEQFIQQFQAPYLRAAQGMLSNRTAPAPGLPPEPSAPSQIPGGMNGTMGREPMGPQ